MSSKITAVLQVDDEVGLHGVFRKTIERRYGAKVVAVTTAHAAIAALQERKFDVAVLDFNLDEGTNGATVLAWCQANMPEVHCLFYSSDKTIASFGIPFVSKPTPISAVCTAIDGMITKEPAHAQETEDGL